MLFVGMRRIYCKTLQASINRNITFHHHKEDQLFRLYGDRAFPIANQHRAIGQDESLHLYDEAKNDQFNLVALDELVSLMKNMMSPTNNQPREDFTKQNMATLMGMVKKADMVIVCDADLDTAAFQFVQFLKQDHEKIYYGINTYKPQHMSKHLIFYYDGYGPESNSCSCSSQKKTLRTRRPQEDLRFNRLKESLLNRDKIFLVLGSKKFGIRRSSLSSSNMPSNTSTFEMEVMIT